MSHTIYTLKETSYFRDEYILIVRCNVRRLIKRNARVAFEIIKFALFIIYYENSLVYIHVAHAFPNRVSMPRQLICRKRFSAQPDSRASRRSRERKEF